MNSPVTTCFCKKYMQRGLLAAAVMATVCFATTARAADAAPAPTAEKTAQGVGFLEGRVYFPGAERYMENVMLRIEGTNLATLSESDGSYRFANVPAGAVTITADFTGFSRQTRTATVTAGKTTQLDINLTTTGGVSTTGKSADDVVKLDKFVVTSTREELGAAIALQEQRYAANMKFVVSAEEFGENPSGNIGEFLAHIPGVAVMNTGGEARTVSLEGTPAAFTPVSFNGFDMANAASGGSGRQVELDTLSLNNLSRVEVTWAPTPETPGNALAGSINMIPRSAFERARSSFTAKTWITLSADTFTLNKTPGPHYTPTRKAGPNLEFNYTVPYNKRFGFTISGARTFYNSDKQFTRVYWRGSAAGVGDANFPYTPPDNPYVNQVDLQTSNILTERASFSITADYKIARNDRLSFAFQYSYLDQKFNDRTLHITMQKMLPGALGMGFSEGFGYLRQEQTPRRKTSTNYMPTLTYRHIGPLWKIDAGMAYSRATTHYTDTNNGFFQNAYADRGNVGIIFSDIEYTGPRKVMVYDASSRNPIDPFKLDDYNLTRVFSRPVDAYDTRQSAYIDVRRDLLLWGVPVWLKAGINVKQAERGITNKPDINWTYIGPDGKTSSASGTPMGAAGSSDDGAKFYKDPSYSTVSMPFGYPAIEWMNLADIYQMYQNNPGYFSLDPDTASNDERAQEVTERISSTYLRGDIQLFNRRLLVVGGVRGERTDIEGKSPLKRTVAGRTYWVKYGGSADVDFTNWFPSLNMNLKITPSGAWLLKAAYYKSIGRPNYNQYMGGITLPNLDADPSPLGNTFTLNNPTIKPWTAETFRVALEYYFARTGLLSVSAFSRKFSNFFVTKTTPVTEEIMANYGLDYNLYYDYYMTTQFNSTDDATVKGLSVSYKQSLTFLPKWARGFTVYAGANFQTVSGPGEPNFYGGTNDASNGQIIPQSYNGGITYNRDNKFVLRCDWTYSARYKTDVITATNIPPGTYTWQTAHNNFNVSGEYNFGKGRRYTVYFSIRNLTEEPQNNYEITGPDTPALASLRYREQYAALWTFGFKGNF